MMLRRKVCRSQQKERGKRFLPRMQFTENELQKKTLVLHSKFKSSHKSGYPTIKKRQEFDTTKMWSIENNCYSANIHLKFTCS